MTIKMIGYERATVSGNKTSINKANKEWLKFRKMCSWLYASGVIKDRKMMALVKFVYLAGYDSAILSNPD